MEPEHNQTRQRNIIDQSLQATFWAFRTSQIFEIFRLFKKKAQKKNKVPSSEGFKIYTTLIWKKQTSLAFLNIPSGKLTWQWKMNLLQTYSLLKMGIFHCYVWLPECKWNNDAAYLPPTCSTMLLPVPHPRLTPPIALHTWERWSLQKS